MIGCLGIVAGLAVLAGEGFSYVVTSHLMTTHGRETIGTSWVDTILPIAVIQVVLMVVGVLTVKGLAARLPQVAMQGLMGGSPELGRLVAKLVGGILLILPGFFLDVFGLLLLFTPVGRLMAGLGQKVMMAILRQQMSKMMGGAMPGGMPGGFPGGFPFPGMQPRGPKPMQPDQRVGGNGKVIDVQAERVERKG